MTGGGLGGGLEAQPSRLSSLHVTPAVPGETALRQARAPCSLGPQTLLRSGCDLKELRRRGQATQLGVPVRCGVQGFGRVGRQCPPRGHGDAAADTRAAGDGWANADGQRGDASARTVTLGK